MSFFKMSFRKKSIDVSKYPDAKMSDWTDAWKCWDLNQEIGRRIFMFEEYAGYDWECDYYDAG